MNEPVDVSLKVTTDGCPTASQLKDWLDERFVLSDQQRRHLGSCERCQQLLESFTDLPEIRLDAHASAVGIDAYSHEAPLHRAIEFLESSGPSSKTLQRDLDTPRDLETLREHDGEATLRSLQSRLPEGRFDLEHCIATGGHGMVWLAFDRQLQRQVAIKVLSRDSNRQRQRLLREAKTMADIDHRHVVRIFDMGQAKSLDESAGDDPAFFYLVMEYVDGGNLTENAPSSWVAKAELIAQAADGLHAAHERGLIHRDVKPSNLLVDQSQRVLKVADFGLARFAESAVTQVTRTGEVVGTPAYMSPEQLRSDQELTAQTDIYSLGATLYQVLTGNLPFSGSTAAVLRQVSEADPIRPRLLDPSIPQDLETICLRAMAKSPDERFSSASSLRDDLRRFTQGEPIHAKPISTWERARHYLSRNRSVAYALLLSLAATITLVASGIAAAFIYRSQNERLAQAATKARQAQANSEAALQSAIQAADQLLVSVAEDTELLPRTPGSQRVRQQLLERAKSYYSAFLEDNSDQPTLTFELAKAHRGLAEIAARISDAEAMESETKLALRLLDEISSAQVPPSVASDSPLPVASVSGIKIQLLRTDVEIARANFLHESADSEAAIPWYQRGLAATSELLDGSTLTDREREECLATRANALRGLAEAMINLGNAEDALPLVHESQQILENLQEETPGRSTYHRDAALGELTLATTMIDRGELTEGKQHLDIAMQHLDAVDSDDAISLRVRELRGLALTNMGLTQRRLGNTQAAKQAYDQAIAEHRRLIELEPSVPSHRWNLVVAVLNSGGPEIDLGREAPLVQRWQSIIPVLDSLIEGDPQNRRYVQVRAMLRSNIAIVLRDLGRHEEAIAPLVAATKTLREEAERLQKSPESYLPVALNHYELASTFHALKRYDEALQSLDQSVQVVTELLDAHPEFHPARGFQLDELLLRFDVVQSQAGETPEGIEALGQCAEAAVELGNLLCKDQSDVVEYQLDLPAALYRRAQYYRMTEKPVRTIADVALAVEQLDALKAQEVDIPQALRNDLAVLRLEALLDVFSTNGSRPEQIAQIDTAFAEAVELGVDEAALKRIADRRKSLIPDRE